MTIQKRPEKLSKSWVMRGKKVRERRERKKWKKKMSDQKSAGGNN